MAIAEIGRSVVVELPPANGPSSSAATGDRAPDQAHSLHSPVLTFTLPGQARAEALRALVLVIAPPPAQPAATSGPVRSGLDRRALLFGRRPTSTPAPRLPD